ncbi:MAG: ribokinase, partial [Pseudomonadota bacterium]|nr:ribokinase [Pseudomonadota bacterium]
MIVVFGSINVDLVVPVHSLPRAGETVLAPSYLTVAGGKGANQAVAAARAGAATHMVGCVGRDGFADLALATMAHAGIDLTAVATVAEPTGCAMIGVDRAGANQIIVASGANRLVKASQLDDRMLGPDATLVLQLEVDLDETWAVVERARAEGARIVLNTAPAAPVPSAIAAACHVLVMNEIEAPLVAEAAGFEATDPVDCARAMAEAWGTATVVTLGAEGARAFDAGGAWKIGALAIEPIDTTAAGDAFVGVLAAALDDGQDLAAALHRASVAGALACQSTGAQP